MSPSTEPGSPKSSTPGAEDAAKEESFNLSVEINEAGLEASVSFGFRTHMKSVLTRVLSSCKRPNKIVILSMVAILTASLDKHQF